jgi:hypothetical protein
MLCEEVVVSQLSLSASYRNGYCGGERVCKANRVSGQLIVPCFGFAIPRSDFNNIILVCLCDCCFIVICMYLYASYSLFPL